MKIQRIVYMLILLVGINSYSCTSEDDDGGNTGDPVIMEEDPSLEEAPDFSLVTTSGSKIESDQFNNKVLVIFFFGYNCPPCKAVGPDVESKLHQAFKDETKFAIIGADQWDGNDAGVDNFQSVTGITFPLGTQGSSMAADFSSTYDRLVVVNDNGKIVFKGNNIVANHLDEVVDLVKDLLK